MKKPLFDYVAGTGGIGTGRFFELEGNHTLGRSESRPALFTEYRDYCKLHIIFHYIAVFLQGEIPVYAIGHIGADEEGRSLKKEMERAGINVTYVTEDPGNPTMYSICCQYPNGEGFNVTANNSACRTVGADDVDRFFNGPEPKGHGIIIAAPEVPLETRLYMLKKGKEKNAFNVAAVSTGEVSEFTEKGGAALADLVALNRDEALAFASLGKGNVNTETEILDSCVHYLQSLNPEITVIITLGRKGALVRHQDRSYKSEAVDIPAVNTAGAGDCFLGTVVAAMVRGIGLFPSEESCDKPACAMDLGIAASNKKITCKDTIDFSINTGDIEDFARKHGILFSGEIQDAFFGCRKKNPNDQR